MKILVDNVIPFIEGLLERLPGVDSVEYVAPEYFTAENVADADALFVRTRTRCNASLLEGSRVKFIATATIGLDHIDRDWCADNGIFATNAPGCNAPGVAQWVFAAIAQCLPDCRPQETTLGIVGVGHIGRVVEAWARAIGFRVLLNDPPREAAEGPEGFVSLDTIAREADIVTFHTPLSRPPYPWPSWHLCGADFLSKLERKPVILNAARGPVVDTASLIAAYKAGLTGKLAIDTWEGEPVISKELMNIATVATPHIAGYSLQGKQRATAMTVNYFREFIGLPRDKQLEAAIRMPEAPASVADVARSYDILADDRMYRLAPDDMERLRDSYDFRNEP
ncbi:MAG: 4-phosphoerythronate dehydrogenase [Muribaculaceae bacterium]|nr:4-phosphoerythronate dehydrogenase [Muribaculaceae bacterium]